MERLGLSGGILGSGAAIGVETLGVGIVVGFVLDALLDRVLAACGHDPAGEIAQKVDEALDMFQGLLLDGDPQAVRTYETLRRLQNDDLFPVCPRRVPEGGRRDGNRRLPGA